MLKTLLTLLILKSAFANANLCSNLFNNTDFIKSAILKNRGLVGAFHISYGEGYLVLQNGKVVFDQNRLDGHRIENVPYGEIALELKEQAKSANEIQKNIPFNYKEQIYKTIAEFEDGTFLCRNDQNRNLEKVSLNDIISGVLKLGTPNIETGDKVNIDTDVVNGAVNARILSLDGMYANVAYDYDGKAGILKYTEKYIPISQIKGGFGKFSQNQIGQKISDGKTNILEERNLKLQQRDSESLSEDIIKLFENIYKLNLNFESIQMIPHHVAIMDSKEENHLTVIFDQNLRQYRDQIEKVPNLTSITIEQTLEIGKRLSNHIFLKLNGHIFKLDLDLELNLTPRLSYDPEKRYFPARYKAKIPIREGKSIWLIVEMNTDTNPQFNAESKLYSGRGAASVFASELIDDVVAPSIDINP